jgi:hypothetical protein
MKKKNNPFQNIADAIILAQPYLGETGGTMSEENYKKLAPLFGDFLLAPENPKPVPNTIASITPAGLRVQVNTSEPIHPALQHQLNLLIGRFCKNALQGKPNRGEDEFLAAIILGGAGSESLLAAIQLAAESTKQTA